MSTKGKEYHLTSSAKRQIIKKIGKCENCPTRKLDLLNIHHIRRECDGGKSTPSNLIVLCYACHKNEAHGGSLSDAKQRKIVRNRLVRTQNDIIEILRKSKKLQHKPKPIKKPKTTRRQQTQTPLWQTQTIPRLRIPKSTIKLKF
jgi:hypothetical protein